MYIKACLEISEQMYWPESFKGSENDSKNKSYWWNTECVGQQLGTIDIPILQQAYLIDYYLNLQW